MLNQAQLDRRIEQLTAACGQDQRCELVEKRGLGWPARLAAVRPNWSDTGGRPKPYSHGWTPTLGGFRPSDCLPVNRVVISPSDPEDALGPTSDFLC